VYAGRIPVYGTAYADLDNILQKTIDYGQDPGDIGWREKVLLPMKPSDPSPHGGLLGENIKLDYADPNGWASYRIYDDDADYPDIDLDPELTPCDIDNVKAEWINHYGLVTWWTHGSSTSASYVFGSSDCGDLDDDYPSFTFQCSCLNGYPESTSNLGYCLLKNGAIGTVSASRVSWYSPGDSNWDSTAVNSYMAHRYSGKIINRVRAAKALFDMKMETAIWSDSRWMNFLVFNLYGDPAIKIDDAGEPCPPPPAPADIDYPDSDCDGDFTVTWSVASGATGYTLERAGDPSFTGAVAVYTGASTSYDESGLADGTYYYRVSSANSCGSSAWQDGDGIDVGAGCGDVIYLEANASPTCQGNTPCYATIEDGINMGDPVHVTKVAEGVYPGDAACLLPRTVTFQALDSSYTIPSVVNISGSLTISDGTLIMGMGTFALTN